MRADRCLLWGCWLCAVLASACAGGGQPHAPNPGGSSADAEVAPLPDGGADAGVHPGATRHQTPPLFPLRVSSTARYLRDSAGEPFLINQASSWGLIQALSTEDARTYLDDLSERGFNTVMISIISNDQRMPGGPPAWQGIDPFMVRWDFSTPNDAYFEHADEILRLARARNMLVTLVPSYLGFADDPTQGWADELLSSQNSVEKSRAYGRYLGRRYRDFDNLVWVAGGDNTPAHGSALEAHMLAIVEGIRAEDPKHLWTAHWSGTDQGSASTDNAAFAPYIDIDGYYAFNYALTYQKDLELYARADVRPFFHIDMSYETEWGGEPPAIRRRAYDALLSGAAGSSFNAGPDWYLFRDFRNMNTTATRETRYWYQLFAPRAWHELVPDTEHTAIVSGYGERGDQSYVCAAHTADYRLVMAYLPSGGSVGVAVGRMPTPHARVSWYDPTRGRTQGTTQLQATGTQVVNAPSTASWVVLVEAVP